MLDFHGRKTKRDDRFGYCVGEIVVTGRILALHANHAYVRLDGCDGLLTLASLAHAATWKAGQPMPMLPDTLLSERSKFHPEPGPAKTSTNVG